MKTIIKTILIILITFTGTVKAQGGSDCSTAEQFCTGTAINFPLQTNNPGIDVTIGPSEYGCLQSAENPVWYYFKIGTAGDLNIQIASDCGDIDYAAWGPFSSLTCSPTDFTANGNQNGNDGHAHNAPHALGNYGAPEGNMVDCAYSNDSIEYLHIANAQVGEYYMVLITNYINCTGNLLFEQTSGTGATDCSFLGCSITSITTPPSICATGTTYDLAGDVIFDLAPTTGTLTICDDISGLCETFNPPFTSPQAYTFSNILADGLTHNLTAIFSDSITCTLTQNYTAPLPTITTVIDTSICNGEDYTYADGSTSTNMAANESHLSTLTNTNGCDSLVTENITVNSNPIADAGSDQTKVCGNNTVTLDGSNSDGGMTYLWSGGNILSAGNTINPTVDLIGIYIILVTNPTTGCNATDSTEVFPNQNIPTVAIIPPGELTCIVNTVSIDGSNSTTTSGNPQYAWSTSNGNIVGPTTNPTVNVDMPGSYTLLLTDITNGCSLSDTVNVSINDTLPTANAGQDQSLTCSNPAINLDGSSSSANMQYNWTTTSGNIVSGATTTNPNIDDSGTYIITVTDPTNGCTAADTTLISPIVALSIDSIRLMQVVCINDNNGEIHIELLTGTAPYTYNISATGNFDQTNTTGDFNNLPPNIYSIIVEDVNSCQTTAQVEINTPTAITIDTIITTSTSCLTACSGAIEIQATNAINYTINGVTSTLNTITNLCEGTYNISVSDINGCEAFSNTTISTISGPTAYFSFDPLYGTTSNPEITFTNLSQDATNYQWDITGTDPDQGFYYNTSEEDFLYLFPENANKYKVCLEAVNNLGCTDTTCYTIEIRGVYSLYVPNTFTPNSDGTNDVFKAYGEGIDLENFTLSIYNRWGELLFTSNDINEGWDGTYNGKLLNAEVYIWKIQSKELYESLNHQQTGRVTLLK